MYRRSDNSESPVPSRTAITGQQDNLPREGIISDKSTHGGFHGNRQFNTRELKRPQVRQNADVGSHTNSFRPINSERNRNNSTRAVPTTRGLNNGTNHPMQNGDRYGTSEMRAMSQTRRIPTTDSHGKNTSESQRGGSAPYLYGTTAVNNRVPRRRPPLKRRILRFVRRYSTFFEIALACLLFFAISVPLVVFALGDPSESVGENTEAVYELEADKDSLGNVKEPSGDPEDKLPMAGDTSESTDGSSDGDTLDSDSSPEETPSEENPDSETDKDPESNETEETEDTETTEAETEDPNKGKFPVTVYFYDREAITCYTEPATLRQILAREGCVLKDSDRPTVDLDEMIEYQSWIMIDSVSYRQVTESEAIPFETVTYESDTVPRGTVKTVTWGVNGSKEKVYTVEYVNGKETNRTFQYEYIASNPTNQVDYYGVGGTFTAPDGTVYSYSHRVEVRATYYNIPGTTATGLPTGHNVVAVDPNVFPLGTEMYVISDSYDMGYRIAADTGGAVKGNLIDLWMDETNPDYIRFAHQGVVNMTAYVLG